MPCSWGSRRPVALQKLTETPSVKLDVATGFLSRNQHCQFQVWPERIDVVPEGTGVWVRSRPRTIEPLVPELAAFLL
jgi:hypothetical protein